MDANTLTEFGTKFILWAVNLLGGGFILLHIVRSIWLEKGLSRDTMKMYLGALFIVVVADLAVIEALPTEVLAGFLGAIIGGTIGTNSTKDQE
jgi:hypothetical protein